jgi:NarL family two-component system sensor histidine kinase YdfH
MPKINWFRTIFSLDDPEVRSERPFFWLLSTVLIGLYITTLVQNPALIERPGLLAVFSLLFILHLILHWSSPWIIHVQKQAFTYLALQGILAFTLSLIPDVPGMGQGLFLALVGETVGFLRRSRTMVAGLIIFLSLSTISVWIKGGWTSARDWLILAGPATLFVVVYVLLYVRQTELREEAQRLADDLAKANQQLKQYAGQIEELTLAAERQRMARELHDTLAQGLVGLTLQLEAADSHLDRQNAQRAQAIIRQAMERARTTLADARQVIDALHIERGIAEDVEAAIEEEINRFCASAGVKCDVSIHLPPRLPDSVGEHLPRIVGEGLTNIARHARAHTAWVRLEVLENHLRLEIGDDGEGFDVAAAAGLTGHYGLAGMRDRALLAKGSLEVFSQPGQGTRLVARFPLQEVT